MKNATSAWKSRADAADGFFEDGDYELALSCYEAALRAIEPLACTTDQVITKDQTMPYLSNVDTGEWKMVVVSEVHTDDAGGPNAEPYYTIQLEDEEGNTIEKQTTKDRLTGSYLIKEKQTFLSKIVECCLFIGGRDNVEAAVEKAKQVSILLHLISICFI